MVLCSKEQRGSKSRPPWDFLGKAVKEDGVSKRYAIEDTVKHGLVNHIPDSGMRFGVVKSKGGFPCFEKTKDTKICIICEICVPQKKKQHLAVGKFGK